MEEGSPVPRRVHYYDSPSPRGRAIAGGSRPSTGVPPPLPNIVSARSLGDDFDAAQDEAIGGGSRSSRSRRRSSGLLDETAQLDETTQQQLRAVFKKYAATGQMDESGLRSAIAMLGFTASTSIVARFFSHRKSPLSVTLDLEEFVQAAIDELQDPEAIEPEIIQLFERFDDKQSGAVSVKTLKHLLCGFASPDRLDQNEFDEFLKQAGFSSDDTLKFDYRKYIHNIMVGKPLTSMVAP